MDVLMPYIQRTLYNLKSNCTRSNVSNNCKYIHLSGKQGCSHVPPAWSKLTFLRAIPHTNQSDGAMTTQPWLCSSKTCWGDGGLEHTLFFFRLSSHRRYCCLRIYRHNHKATLAEACHFIVGVPIVTYSKLSLAPMLPTRVHYIGINGTLSAWKTLEMHHPPKVKHPFN